LVDCLTEEEEEVIQYHSHHPSLPHSFTPCLKPFFSANPSHRSLSFSSSELTPLTPSWTVTDTRPGTGSHFVTQRPSDPGIQRPGDPVDPVTLFYNELQMSTYVADKRLQWATGLPVFIAVWRLHASGK